MRPVGLTENQRERGLTSRRCMVVGEKPLIHPGASSALSYACASGYRVGRPCSITPARARFATTHHTALSQIAGERAAAVSLYLRGAAGLSAWTVVGEQLGAMRWLITLGCKKQLLPRHRQHGCAAVDVSPGAAGQSPFTEGPSRDCGCAQLGQLEAADATVAWPDARAGKALQRRRPGFTARDSVRRASPAPAGNRRLIRGLSLLRSRRVTGCCQPCPFVLRSNAHWNSAWS